MSGLFDWIIVFIWAVFVIPLTLLMLIRISFSVFCFVWFSYNVHGSKDFEDLVERLDPRFGMCHSYLFVSFVF